MKLVASAFENVVIEGIERKGFLTGNVMLEKSCISIYVTSASVSN